MMNQEDTLIVSVSGIRGIIGKGLTPEQATAFAASLGTSVGGGAIVLCRDSRPSGTMLRHAVLAGLMSTGCSVIDIGIAPTPTCGLAVQKLQAAGAIQITASHNPAPWNGLKLFAPEGSVLSADQGKHIQDLYQESRIQRVAWDRIGTVTTSDEAIQWHQDKVAKLVDVQAIASRRFGVFLDANGGAGGPLGQSLLQSLGCTVHSHGCDPDGIFLHPPEPTADNLADLAPMTAQYRADLGLALDPDADRLALLDETGRYIGEEATLALAVQFRLQQERGPVVINMSTSRMAEDIARRFDCPCHRSAVGEANVVQKMREVGAVIGGEGNGGVIDPRVGGVRDPFIGMALILNLMQVANSKLSELAAQLPAYTIVKNKYVFDPGRLASFYQALQQRWPEAVSNHTDGLRLDWPDRWIHARPSNTEPVVRVIAEAPELGAAEELCRNVSEVLEGDCSTSNLGCQ